MIFPGEIVMQFFIFLFIIISLGNCAGAEVLETSKYVKYDNETTRMSHAQAPQKKSYKVSIGLTCVCSEGEAEPDLYLVGIVVYFGDKDKSNKVIRKGQRFKTKVQDNTNQAYFENVATTSGENNKNNIGVYVEVWDEDTFSNDFIGSAKARYDKTEKLDYHKASKLHHPGSWVHVKVCESDFKCRAYGLGGVDLRLN